MKTFMLLHYGFENPTAEIMQAWGKWFKSISDSMVDACHFPIGKEISKNGIKELPLMEDSITDIM